MPFASALIRQSQHDTLVLYMHTAEWQIFHALTSFSVPSLPMKAVTLPSPPIALGSLRRLLTVPARGRPISWSLVASMPSKADEAKSKTPLVGWATAPITPLPTPLKKPAGHTCVLKSADTLADAFNSSMPSHADKQTCKCELNHCCSGPSELGHWCNGPGGLPCNMSRPYTRCSLVRQHLNEWQQRPQEQKQHSSKFRKQPASQVGSEVGTASKRYIFTLSPQPVGIEVDSLAA